MGIYYDEQKRIFTIHTERSTYQMQIDRLGALLHLYYGAKINCDMDHLIRRVDRAFSPNAHDALTDRTYSLDVLPLEYSGFGTGDFRSAALHIRNADESECCDLRYVKHEILKGKYSLTGLPAVRAGMEEAQTLKIDLRDSVTNVGVQLLYGVLEKEDIITRSAIISNGSHQRITVEKAASACLDFQYGQYDLIGFPGRHAMERCIQRTKILQNRQSFGSVRGTSSHQQNPALIIAEPDTTEKAGNCYGMMMLYSGNFLAEAEQSQFGQTRVILGLQEELFHYPLEPGEKLTVPETVLSFSCSGFETLSHTYHRCVRDHICDPKWRNAARPVLINSWEAAYFHFDGEKILSFAKAAKELDIDMLVLDDGWFGKRDDDNSGLGDWIVNTQKLGCTMGELSGRIHALGMKFGLWFEPEMVSEDSDLYREHPDWALQIPGRGPAHSRNQLVLDFSRKDVRDCIFAQVCDVLDHAKIDYVKLDMNRSLVDIYSHQRTVGQISYDYVLGVYDFLDRLTTRYPELLIESCSGGGGRFDAGMMYYTPQIWCSDNTDAVDRLWIQHGTSYFYPLSTVGSHVSAVPNHQTGRVTPLKTRGVVAMAGTFGYELDPRSLTDEEKQEVRAQVKTYRESAELLRNGDYYRLTDPNEEEYVAWQLVSPDRREVIFSAVSTRRHANQAHRCVRLRGLIPDAVYVDSDTGDAYTGAALMNGGIVLPVWMKEYEACRIHFQVR